MWWRWWFVNKSRGSERSFPASEGFCRLLQLHVPSFLPSASTLQRFLPKNGGRSEVKVEDQQSLLIFHWKLYLFKFNFYWLHSQCVIAVMLEMIFYCFICICCVAFFGSGSFFYFGSCCPSLHSDDFDFSMYKIHCA